ncbi:MAG: DNA topoisomerase IB [Gemmatimonadales bacterium]
MEKSSKRSNRRRPVGAFTAPEDAARAADLRHGSNEEPGITRQRCGRGFSYRSADGTLVRDRKTLARIRSLVIPPAWTAVWICPIANGHIQATGRDARSRKQYRYHPRWHEIRDATKYERMIAFGHALPKIRARLDADLALGGVPKAKVLATVVQLLATTFIRVGNEEYARANGSFGLTTMQDRHVAVDGSQIQFRFRGKSGKAHAVRMTDRRLARTIRRIRDLPGQDLFQFLDDTGEPQPITSSDVNDYLREVSSQDFTAKDFRTWAGTLLAAAELAAIANDEDAAISKAAEVAAVKSVAERLGNTVAVCRKCYIHPDVLQAFVDHAARERWTACAHGAVENGLEAEEGALLRFLAQ